MGEKEAVEPEHLDEPNYFVYLDLGLVDFLMSLGSTLSGTLVTTVPLQIWNFDNFVFGSNVPELD